MKRKYQSLNWMGERRKKEEGAVSGTQPYLRKVCGWERRRNVRGRKFIDVRRLLGELRDWPGIVPHSGIQSAWTMRAGVTDLTVLGIAQDMTA